MPYASYDNAKERIQISWCSLGRKFHPFQVSLSLLGTSLLGLHNPHILYHTQTLRERFRRPSCSSSAGLFGALFARVTISFNNSSLNSSGLCLPISMRLAIAPLSMKRSTRTFRRRLSLLNCLDVLTAHLKQLGGGKTPLFLHFKMALIASSRYSLSLI